MRTMTITSEHKKAVKKQPNLTRKAVAQPKSSIARPRKTPARAASPTAVANLRNRLDLTQAQFARLLPISVRSLATLESGAAPTEAVTRRLTELERLMSSLSEVIQKESLGRWLQTPNQAFSGSKPLEVIERGESDRLWEMIYFLRSGVPS